MHSFAATVFASLLILATGCSYSPVQPSLEDAGANPEPASAALQTQNKTAEGRQFVAVTANSHASEAARNILRQNGSAIDAAIAAQMVLGLVEPQSSGLGGGGFLLYWDAAKQQLYSYDGRETAPQAVDETLFLGATGQPLSMLEAIVGGRSVGVPGMVDMLAKAHRQHGVLPWRTLFEEGVVLAEQGFKVSPRLHTLLQKVPYLQVRPAISAYFFARGEPLAEGALLKNPDYASSLRMLAESGGRALYQGPLAASIVDAVKADSNPGSLNASDFQRYQAVQRAPVCRVVFAYKLCGMGPPSSGATTVLSTLKQLELLLEKEQIVRGETIPGNADVAHAFIEATRLAFADRNTYLADPDFVDVPIEEMLDTDYLKSRALQIMPEQRTAQHAPGELPGWSAFVESESLSLPSTTHMSIVDQQGNIVSMTTSIETAFGSRLMANGFLLNNQLTDFSFAPVDADKNKIANRVQAGKRPLSSMSPMIIFNKSNEPVMVVGSPGGKSIIPYVARVIYDHIVGGLDLEQAIAGKHVVDTGRLRLEQGIDETLVAGLREKGHEPTVGQQSSGIHALHRSANGWVGVADQRREGTVAAD